MKKYRVMFPKNVTNSKGTHRFLCSLYNEFKYISNTKIYIDFSNTKWIEPNLMSILGLVLVKISSQKNKIYFSYMNPYIIELFRKYGFLRKLKKPLNIPQNYIVYKTFNGNDDELFRKYLYDQFKEIKSYESIDILINRLVEVFVNVKMHARKRIMRNRYKNKEIYCNGYYNKNKNYLIFSIANNGRTFKETISNHLNYETDKEVNFITWSIKQSNSTRQDSPGGLGLFLLNDFIKESNGELIILSGKGYYNLNKNLVIAEDFKVEYPGTAITVKVPISYLINFKAEKLQLKSFSLEDLVMEEY